jgi:transcriptional regulator with XRE-family HTH domain
MSFNTILDNVARHKECKNDADLCRATGLNPPTVSKIKKGIYSENTGIKTLQLIAKTSGFELATIVRWWELGNELSDGVAQ